MTRLAAWTVVFGGVLVVVGVCLVYVPAGLIVAGALLAASGFSYLRGVSE